MRDGHEAFKALPMMTPTLPLANDFIKAHEPKISPLLERFANTGSLHSTLMFSGVEGVGKKSFVLYFVQLLFCDRSIFAGARADDESETMSMFGDAVIPSASQQAGLRQPCGECKSCLRTLKAQWFDLFWFEPETNEEGTRLGQHKIEAFRELKGKLGLGPSEEPFKVVVITDAERMTAAAANSILKMLEEPPKNWMFILTTSDSSRVLPTILSRCNEVKLNPLSPEKIFSILKASKGLEFSSVRGKVASQASLGSLTRAMTFLDDETWELRAKILGFLSNPTNEWIKLIDALAASQRQMHLGLDVLESVLSDLLSYDVLGETHSFVHDDQKEMLIQLVEAKKLTHDKLTKVLSTIAEMRRLASLTLNAKLLAQEILVPVLSIL
jgi:DNA polymerase-3 subunit delta'